MSKRIEQLAIVFVLGATAFVIWRAYRNSLTLGKGGNMIGANASDLSRFRVALTPKADSLIDSIWGGSADTGASQYVDPLALQGP